MIHDFRKEHGNIIVKPLYGNGGAGVFFIQEGDHNLGEPVGTVREQLPRALHDPEIPA
jgi:glutathione synthase